MLLLCFSALMVLWNIDMTTGQGRSPVAYALQCNHHQLSITCGNYIGIIHVIAVYLVEGFNSGCNTKGIDCFIAVRNGTFFNDIIQQCQHKDECSGIRVPSQSTDGSCNAWRDMRTDYAVVEYRCVYDTPHTWFPLLLCNDEHIESEMCSDPKTSIEIQSILVHAFHDQNKQPGSCEVDISHDCVEWISDADNDYYVEIHAKCDGKRACTNLTGQSVPLMCSQHRRHSDYTTLAYGCPSDETLLEASRCYGKSFNDISCGPEETIHVVNGFFGDISTADTCSDDLISSYDCRVSVTPAYMARIVDTCEGKRSCSDLRARRSSNTYCNPLYAVNEYSEYVTLVYRCISDGAPPTMKPTMKSTAVPLTTSWIPTLYTTEVATRKDDSIPPSMLPSTPTATLAYPGNPTAEGQASTQSSPSTGLIVGVTLGIVILAVIIILVVVFVLRKKRKTSLSRTTSAAAYSNQIYDGSVANNNDIVISPVSGQAKNSKPGPVAIKPSTDSPDYSLATAVDEYAKVDKDRPRKKFDDYSLAGDTEIDHDAPSHGDYSLATGEQLGNAPGVTGYPGSYGNTDRNPQYRTKEHGMIDGPQQQLAARRDLDDNDLVVEDNANYEGGQFPARGPIHGNPNTLISHDGDLVITDNAQYEAGQFQDRDPRERSGTLGNEDVSHSDLVMVGNANYEKSNFSRKNGPQPADKVDISATYEALDHSRPEEADDTDVTIIDNADYVGYEGV